VADPSPDARSAARDHGAATVVERADALPGVAGVIVAAPTTVHAQVVDDVLPRDVPLFVEKPLTADPGVAARLAARGNGRLFVMDKWRYHPGVEMLGHIARSGELGPVRGLHSTRLGWDGPHPDVDCLWILLPHDLSIAIEVLGGIPEPRAARVERLACGPAGLVALLGDEPWLSIDVSVMSTSRRRELRLVCRDGVAVLPHPQAPQVEILRAFDGSRERLGPPETRAVSSELPLVRELRAFVDHVAGGPPPKSSAREGAAAVACLHRLRALAGLEAAG
jgi:predicted dehydrogenase